MKRMAAIFLTLLTMAGPAPAMTVSAKVGPLLKEAQHMIAAKNYKGAMAKLDEANAVKVSADDEAVINMMRQVVATASSDPTKPHCTSATMGMTNCNGHPAGGTQH